MNPTTTSIAHRRSGAFSRKMTELRDATVRFQSVTMPTRSLSRTMEQQR